MRAAVIAGLLALTLVACSPKDAAAPKTVAESRPRTAVDMADPQTASQLLSGFHQVENNAWRWTERQFTVALGTPRSSEKGAVLALRLTIPPAITDALRTITLSASIQGSDLAPETYAKPGNYTYLRDIAPDLLAGDSVRLTFRLDKALPPTGGDIRELGIIAQSISLAAK